MEEKNRHIELINKTIATKLFGLVEGRDFGEWAEHNWKTDKDGVIDDMAFAFDNHNGPQCTRCWYYYCEHCQDGPEDPCKIELKDYTSELNFWELLKKVEDKLHVNFSIRGGSVMCLVSGTTNYENCAITMEESMSLALSKALYEYIEKGHL